MVGTEGAVKVLDFGLAKLVACGRERAREADDGDGRAAR